MTTAFTVKVDGNEITEYVRPESLRIQREWGSRNGYAEFVAAKTAGATGYYAHPDTLPGVRAWWRMNEESGNLQDASGNGRALTVNGTPVYYRNALAKAQGGRSIRFDGLTDFFHSTSAGLKFSGDFSFGMWVRLPPGEVGPTGRSLMSNKTTGAGWQAFIVNTGASANLDVVIENAGGTSDLMFLLLPESILDGKSHQIVVTYTDATKTVRAYVDGEFADDAVSTVSPGTPTTDFELGRNSSVAGPFFKGRMEHAFLSDDVLTTQQIMDLYSQGTTVAKITRLQALSEITIEAEDGTVRFGGYASSVLPVSAGAFDADQRVTVVSWERRFDSIRVTGRWFNMRTDQIIADIFGADDRLTGFDLTKVRRGRQVDQYEKADAKLSDVLDQLAAWDVFTWRVSADGTQLIYQPLSMTRKRTWYITDDSALLYSDDKAHGCEGFDFSSEMLNPLSKVIVKGGTALQDLNPRHMDASGAKSGAYADAAIAYNIEFDIVPRANEDEISVEINDGTGVSPVWSDLEVGRLDRDELIMNGGDKEVLWAPLTRTFLFDETAVPPAIYGGPGNPRYAWRFYAQKRVMVKVVVRDAAAEKRLGGLYEDVIVDTAILTTDDANRRARQEISNRSKERHSARALLPFEVDGNSNQTPLQVGDLLHVINIKRSVDTRDFGDGLQVQRIVTSPRDGGGSTVQHEVFLGYWPKDDIDMQYELSRRIERIEVDDFFDAEEEQRVIDFGYDGDPSDTEGVMVIESPTWGFTRV